MNSLEKKFVLIVTIVATLFFGAFLVRNYLSTKKAIDQMVFNQTKFALEFDLAIRSYVTDTVRPFVMKLVPEDEFIPEVMSSSFVARSVFEKVQQKFPDTILKFCSDNPRNPANIAGLEELKVIEYFKSDPEAKTWSGPVTIGGKHYTGHFFARRMDGSCLHCHGDPQDAPASMIERYGNENGFYRQVGEVIAADMVAFPMEKAHQEMLAEFFGQSISTLLILFLLVLAMIFTFRYVVSSRLVHITKHFAQLSIQEESPDIELLTVDSNDEIGVLSRSFNGLAEKISRFYSLLEWRVAERTRDLKKSNNELQHEILERKRAENALRLNQARLQALVDLGAMQDASQQALADFALEQAVRLTASCIGYLAFVNDDETMLQIYSYSKQAISECSVKDVIYDYPVEKTGLWGEVIRQRRPIITNDYAAPNPLKRGLPEGHVALTRHMNAPLFDGDHIVAVVGVGNKTDPYDESDLHQLMLLMQGMWQIMQRQKIDEEKLKLQEALLQSKKMEAVGRLAGGVAHDFNNLLTGISGYAELIELISEENKEIGEQAGEIKNAAQRGADLTRQLLAFSRRQVQQPKTISLNDVIDNLQKVLRRVVGESVDVQVIADVNLKAIKADPMSIEQVLINLVMNAAEAMPKGGKLTIQTRKAEIKHSLTLQRLSLHPGEYAILEVCDTGEGMNQQTKERIFEPFFTTKEFGKSSGLGLAMVYGIMEQSGGAIEVESVEGQGTTFRLYFPIVQEIPKDSQMAMPTQLPVGHETVLVVEDEKVVRHLTGEFLRRQGYNVIEAHDGLDALRIMDTNKRVDLLLTDVIMPQMNGKELAELLKEKYSNLRMIFMSGYTREIIDKQGVIDENTHFISKPFDLLQLSNKVREVLDSA